MQRYVNIMASLPVYLGIVIIYILFIAFSVYVSGEIYGKWENF